MMKPGNITLISFGYFRDNLPVKILKDVESEFLIPVITLEGHLDISEFYNSNRNQYDGNLLLKEVEKQFAANSGKTLALFNVDLFIPILTYIFGQAFLNGRCGIASVYRLRNEKYGMQSDEVIFQERVLKEVIHELGHTFGLIHCIDPECVMHSSTYVEDIDQKSRHFCVKCKTVLKPRWIR
jgi:archaemetzincin